MRGEGQFAPCVLTACPVTVSLASHPGWWGSRRKLLPPTGPSGPEGRRPLMSTVIDITSVGRASVDVHGRTYKLSPVERRVINKVGGSPWTIDQATPEVVSEAWAVWTALSHAAGYAWKAADGDFRAKIAAALNCTEADLDTALGVSFCPMATMGCIAGCVTNCSYHASLDQTQKTRLLRDAFFMMRSDLALALTADQLRRTVAKAGGKDKARRRVNISDDIRWEVVAPGLLDVAPLGYTYTKWLPEERPAIEGLSIVYSANERWSDTDIVDACGAGHRVAVVFDVPKKKLPNEWNQTPVADGDSTDDLYEHPAGVIVGLAVKGRTAEIKQAMARTGFARAA